LSVEPVHDKFTWEDDAAAAVSPVGAEGGVVSDGGGGGVGAPAPDTNVVTLDAGSVAENALPETVTALCCARSNEADVTHGVTEPAVEPFSVTVTGVSDPF
jgi:hypothetical protein